MSGVLLRQKYLLTLWKEIYNEPVTFDYIIYNIFFLDNNKEVNDKWIIQLFPKQDILSWQLLKKPSICYDSLNRKALLLCICLQIKEAI